MGVGVTTILVADDNWSDLKALLAAWLRGFDLTFESRGDRVLSLLGERPDIGVVLLDLHFDDQPMQGQDVVTAIHKSYPLVQVMILSAEADVELALSLKEAGTIRHYFVKNKLERDKLNQHVRAAVEFFAARRLMSFQPGSRTLIEQGLYELIAKERVNPYRGLKESLSDRIAAALRSLEHVGLDYEAAAILFAQVLYFSSADLEQAWLLLGSKLEKWFQSEGLQQAENTYWIQVKDEPHITHYFQANNLPGRSDPEIVPPIWDVERLWSIIKTVPLPLSRSDVTALAAVTCRPVWVLLWDLNLSGKTVAKELSRIAKCLRTIRPNGQTVVHVASQVLTSDARDRIKAAYSECGLVGEIFSGIELTPNHRLQTTTTVNEETRDRLLNLCRSFHAKLMSEDPDQRWLRGIGPLGYENGGWLFATQINCPNNSIPALWFCSQAAKEPHAHAYRPPFPRIPSKMSHLSLAPYDLDNQTEAERNFVAEKVAKLIASR